MGLYQKWQAHHGKARNGLPSPDDQKRFEIFKDNLYFVDEHNSVDPDRSYKVGLNKFADLTNEEYRSMFLGNRPARPYTQRQKVSHRYRPQPGDRLPKAVDWRKLGAVNDVKDQGQCGMNSSYFFN